MTRDEILKIARIAEVSFELSPDAYKELVESALKRLEHFAELVAAKEREECAKVCETEFCGDDVAYYVAAAIRARGEK